MRLLLCALATMLVLPAAPAAESAAAPARLIQKEKADKTFVRGSPLPAWAQPLAEIAPTSRRDPLVFRLRETQSWVGAVPATLINQALQVNDASSLAAIGQYSIAYNPAYQKLLLHRVAILRGGQVLDRTRQADIRILQQEQQLQNGVYGGANTVQLLLDDVRVGDTLWISYTTEGRNPVFGKRWSDDFSWDVGAPAELRRVTVLHPRQRPLHWRQLGDFHTGTLRPVIDRVGDIERIRFEGKGLEGVDGERSVPSDYMAVRMIQMSEFDSWKSVAGWAADLFPAAAPTPALQQQARQFAGAADKAAQAAAALHWVQDEIRYFSVSIGENSHRPQAPDVVLRRRYGDCKDKAYLLVSLLGQLGIAARPVLVNAEAPGLPAKVIPSPTWFDHVIVRIELDGKTIYVDPTRTGQKGPLARLPVPLPDAPGLPVDAAADALAVLPPRDDSQPEFEHLDRIVIASFDGDAVLESRDVYRGSYAEAARRRIPIMNATELKKYAFGSHEKQYPGITLAEPPRFEDKPAEGSFEITATFKLTKAVELVDGNYQLPYASQIIDGTLGIPDNLTRQFPFAYPRGKTQARYRLHIVWPDTVRHTGEVRAKTVDNAFMRVHEEYTFRSNDLDYLLDYRLKSDRIAAADLPKLQRETKQLTPFVQASFRVSQSAVAKEAGEVLSLREVNIARRQVALRAWERDSATRTGMVPVEQSCAVLDGYVNMLAIDLPGSAGMANSTIDAFRRDQRPGTATCLGRTLFIRGDFAGSIAAFERAKLRDDDPALAMLAWARLHAGQGAEAAADMLRLVRARGSAGVLDALDIADATALLRRSGTALPPELAAAARELPDGPWPRPVLALQAGTLDAQALLVRAGALSGDAGALALDDAWMYIAEQRLADGDRRGAIVALQELRAHAVLGTHTWIRAMGELAALAPKDADYQAGEVLWSKKNFTSGLALMRRAAERGVAEAQFRVGMAYDAGDGVKADTVEAARWFKLAARQDHAGANNMLGYYMQNGLGGFDNDVVGANERFLSGAELGNAAAALNLGRNYLAGNGLVRDAALGERYLRRAAALNQLDAQALLAARYAEGAGFTQDDRAALYWAGRATMRGSEAARVTLGRMLWKGQGLDKDPAAGTRLIRLAADKGNAEAAYFMGQAYRYGIGIDQDPAQGITWLQKAARARYLEAALDLGFAYMNGESVRQDKAQARIWFDLAAAGGEAVANLQLGKLYASGDGGGVDLARAAGYYRKAAVVGEPEAQIALARMYQAGSGVERSERKAMDWYRDAARFGTCEAMEGLAEIYEAGRGVAPDVRLAQVYYALAARNGKASSSCTGAAAKASQLAGRLDAGQLASAEASAKAWEWSYVLPDETRGGAAKP